MNNCLGKECVLRNLLVDKIVTRFESNELATEKTIGNVRNYYKGQTTKYLLTAIKKGHGPRN